MNNFIVIVLDGVGIGELPDAGLYKDEGSNTLANISDAVDGLELPNLEKLGIGNIDTLKGISFQEEPLASYGKLTEVSIGKDSTSGHWELGGLPVNFEFPLYPNGFPEDVIRKFIDKTGVKNILWNKTASGTEIIERLGDEHVKTGYPIIYTSGDSVFQIAAHEDIIPLDRLYQICEIARYEVLLDEHSVARVIARPFVGVSGKYTRTTNRKDFSVAPFGDTILDVLNYVGINTIGIGKINDLFNYKGIKIVDKTKSNLEGIKKIIDHSMNAKNSLIFANLVDFDVYFGHRNNPVGFHDALKEFDAYIPAILESLDETDALVITADHGNDPTTPSTDHSREYVPLLFYRKNVKSKNLGIRKSFSDVAQTVAQYFKVNNSLSGESFLNF